MAVLPGNASNQPRKSDPSKDNAPIGFMVGLLGRGGGEIVREGDDGATHRAFIQSGSEVARR